MDTPKKQIYSWYSIIGKESPLEQGDFIDNFPIPQYSVDLIDTADGKSVPTTISTFNVIVMTQSCDLAQMEDDDDVILCPRSNYEEVDQYKSEDNWNKLIKGNYISSHLLNRCNIEGYIFDYQIVNLKKIFPIPFSYVNRVIQGNGERVRLLPPYREFLAQAFARQFMRIGLPIDIPKEYPYKNPK
jgi:hypothetical protein